MKRALQERFLKLTPPDVRSFDTLPSSLGLERLMPWAPGRPYTVSALLPHAHKVDAASIESNLT